MREFKQQFVPRPDLAVPGFLRKKVSVKELEIGAGDGEFAFHSAKSCPHSHFIAIEKSRSLFNRMFQKYQKEPLSNLWIFHTNAVWWISHFLLPDSIDKAYIFYPNVYVKPRQSNLRWFNRPFMSYLLNCLKPGGRLEIRTNEKKYYEECKIKMNNFHDIKNTRDFYITRSSASPFKARYSSLAGGNPSFVHSPGTAFERKYLAQGQICRGLIYTRFI